MTVLTMIDVKVKAKKPDMNLTDFYIGLDGIISGIGPTTDLSYDVVQKTAYWKSDSLPPGFAGIASSKGFVYCKDNA